MKNNKKVYFALCADFLHHAHIKQIKQAQSLGNLTLGLLTDEAIASYKRVTVMKYNERKLLLKSIFPYSKIVPHSTHDYTTNIKKLKPDILVHGDDWIDGNQKRIRAIVINLCRKYKIQMVELKYVEGISSSVLIDRANNSFNQVNLNYFLKTLNTDNNLLIHSDKIKGLNTKSNKKKFKIISTPNDNFFSKNYLSKLDKIIKLNIKNIICVGDYKAIDFSKIVKLLSCLGTNRKIKSSTDLYKIFNNLKNNPRNDVKLIIFPTTIGLGSEFKNFFYVNESKYFKKFKSDKLYPDKVFFDQSLFNYFSNQNILLNNDFLFCLAQSFEAIFSKNSNSSSNSYAIKSINFSKKILDKQTLNILDLFTCSNYSAKSINISGSNIIYSLSNYLLKEHNIPIGYAMFLFLPSYLEIFFEKLNNNLKINVCNSLLINNISEIVKLLDEILKILIKKNIYIKLKKNKNLIDNLFKNIDPNSLKNFKFNDKKNNYLIVLNSFNKI